MNMNQASESLAQTKSGTTEPARDLLFPDPVTLKVHLKLPDPLPVLIEELKRLGIAFASGDDEVRLDSLDPDKFYLAFIEGTPDKAVVDSMQNFFKKGAIMFLNKKDSLKEYTLEDLKSMYEGLGLLIGLLEKQNKVTHSRFDIIKE